MTNCVTYELLIYIYFSLPLHSFNLASHSSIALSTSFSKHELKFKLILFLFLTISLSYIISDLPEFGESKASDSYVTNYYLENTNQEIGIPNVVTSVLASYRGFDTLGEVVVIFIAGISVIGILREENKEQ